MTIQKVAVIGAGVMGAGIAAQLANAGLEVELLDRVDSARFPNDNDGVAKGAIDALIKNKPAAFMHKKNAKKIRPGNTTDHMDRLKDCDLIIEAVFEDPKVKYDIFQKIDAHRKAGSIVASNTSTIPLKNLVDGQSDQFKKDFVITHFFNPPRYMPLLELITSADNSADMVAKITRFMDEKMGKGVVVCNDTPGFIANRIGTFWIQAAINEAHNKGLTVEEADALIGKPMGIPKTGIFGLVDLVGLDLMPKISASLTSKLPADDGYVKISTEYPVISKMIADGYTGRKGKGGFYRLGPNKEKLAVDLTTGAERPQIKKVKLPALDAAAKGGLKGLLESKDKGGDYAWSVLSQTIVYAAEHAHSVSDSIMSVDTAMKLGYNWEEGPFELADKIGVDYIIKRLEREGRAVPQLLRTAAGKTFYKVDGGKLNYIKEDGSYAPVVRAEGVLLLSDIKLAQKPLYSVKKKLPLPGKAIDMGAHIWDIGDGVLCVEFDSTMNMLDFTSMKVLNKACDMIEKSNGKYEAMVIHNEGKNFSTGANLPLAVVALKLRQYWLVDKLVKKGQDTMKRLKYAPFPVVSAPSGMALGGGCEVLMHSAHVQAHAETYPGLVEVGVGLLPAWGGTTELISRATQNKKLPRGPMPPVAMVFETISTAKVGTSAQEARDIMILRDSDGITMNKQRLLADAKQKAIELAVDYKPPAPLTNIELPGSAGEAALNLAVDGFHLKGAVTNYDVVVSNKVAKVITGGDLAGPGMQVSQDYLRDLERKHFMELVHDGRTLNRIVKTLPPNKGRKQYEAEERKDAVQAPQGLRDAADKPGLFARVFGGGKGSAKKSFGQVCAKNDNKPQRDTKAKVNWPRFGK